MKLIGDHHSMMTSIQISSQIALNDVRKELQINVEPLTRPGLFI
jgi:hypothetical protein